jgi:hypothetical protein
VAVVEAVEGYGGLAEPELRGTDADLRGIWGRGGEEMVAMEREGLETEGYLKVFG